MVLDRLFGAEPYEAHDVAHSALGDGVSPWPSDTSARICDAGWISRVPLRTSFVAEFAAHRHQRATSFCTIDLTKVDPGALCKSKRGSCMMRNAVCDSEAAGGHKPTYHCLCRPGSCATSAGVCVEEKCTKEVAKVLDGGAGADSQKAKSALAEQEKLDNAVPDDKETKGQKSADKKQPDMNAAFAGHRGIMPSGSVPGGSPSQQEDDGDYKIKFVLPNASSATGSGGPVQIGSPDFDPRILDGLGVLTQKLEQAERLKYVDDDGWGDGVAPARSNHEYPRYHEGSDEASMVEGESFRAAGEPPAGGLDQRTISIEKFATTPALHRPGSMDYRGDVSAGGDGRIASSGQYGEPFEFKPSSMPVDALIVSFLAPERPAVHGRRREASHFRPAGSTIEKQGLRPCSHMAVTWAAFLSSAA